MTMEITSAVMCSYHYKIGTQGEEVDGGQKTEDFENKQTIQQNL